MDKKSNNKVSEEYIDIVKNYVHELISSGFPVDAAFVFGSTVKGTAHKWSDIDTCIVSNAFGEDRLSNRVFLMRKARRVSELIEPHPFLPSDFNDKFNPLANEIKRTGVRVY